MHNLVSFFGIFLLMFIAWLFSAKRSVVNWRVVLYGTALQIAVAVFIFVIPVGSTVFLFINDVIVKVLDSATAGTQFLFGRLALPPGAKNAAGEESLGFFLAFQALPTVVFFASLMAALYYLGVMQKLIGFFSRVFTRLMRVSGAESLCAASNIFVGVESAMTIRPYLDRMTRSELHTILTAGMATIASSMMALYVFMLQSSFPTIAGHLVSASLLSAPAAIVMSKLLLPETEKPVTLRVDVKPYHDKEATLMEAIINGANSGVKLVVGITALLLAMLGMMALVDQVLSGAGAGINALTGAAIDWSLKGLLGYLFYPLTLVIGVPFDDAALVARLIGERTVLTEVTSYQDLATALAANAFQHPRSVLLASYALCGFAHIPSLAIFVGGIAALAPTRAGDLARVGFRALFAAILACLMTAAVAGTFFIDGSILLGN